MVRANTIETQGKPGLTGDVGGMYLLITALDTLKGEKKIKFYNLKDL